MFNILSHVVSKNNKVSKVQIKGVEECSYSMPQCGDEDKNKFLSGVHALKRS